MKDAQFAARVRAGDREALQQVVRAYLGQILRAARAAGLGPASAEDVTQATFATFIEAAPRFEGRSHVQLRALGAEARRSWGTEAQDAETLEQLERKILERF